MAENKSDKEYVINKINEIWKNKLIIVAGLVVIFVLIAFSVLWLGILLLLIMIYVVYRVQKDKEDKLNIDEKVLSFVSVELKQLDEKGAEEKKKLFRIFGYYYTGNWFIKIGAVSFDFFNKKDIIWVHGKNVRHSVNFVPTGTTYGIVMYLRNGKVLNADYGRDAEQSSKQLIYYLQRIAPGIAVGYSPQLMSLWNKERSKFLQLTDQNKQSMINANSQAQEAFKKTEGLREKLDKGEIKAERISKEKIRRESGYLYYVRKDGYVWRLPTKQNPNGKKSRAGKEKVKRINGYLYFIDKEGYVARVPQENGS